jgi:hypothetical protein
MRKIDFQITFVGATNEHEGFSTPNPIWKYVVGANVENTTPFWLEHAPEARLAKLKIATQTCNSYFNGPPKPKCVLAPITPHPQHDQQQTKHATYSRPRDSQLAESHSQIVVLPH